MPMRYEPASFDWRAYYAQRAALMTTLPAKAYARTEYADAYHPYPVLLSGDEVKTLTAIGYALGRAVQAVVDHYFDDRRIRHRVSLPREVRVALRRLRHQPFHPGFLRADFLHDRSGVPWICEINARFVFNGLILSTNANRAFGQLYPDALPLTGLDDLDSVLDGYAHEPAVVVKGREAGYDLHLFLLANSSARLAKLSEIETVLGERPDRVILELHQDELSGCLEPIVDTMLSGCTVVNDPRTVFIAHDKRLLSVLSNSKIMRDHVDNETVDLLERHVIKSWTTGRNRKRTARSVASRKRWIAKRAISGKSDGLVLGSRVTKPVWKATVASPDFVLQKHLSQWNHGAWHPGFRELRDWNLAGTLPIIDGRCFGPGLYRLFSVDSCRFFCLAQPMQAA